jgi:glycosyltransferase involved in cell wall biosynthesis
MITIIIPFYNEESKNKKSLTLFLKDLSKYISQKFNNKNKFILIDDGSRDKTVRLINEFIRRLKKNQKNKVTFLSNEKNRGHSYTINRGYRLCKTKYMMALASDYDHPFLDLSKFTSRNIDLVMFPWVNIEKYSRTRLVLSTLFNLFYSLAFNVKVNYIQAPCLYKVRAFRKIKIRAGTGGTYLSELAVKLLRSNIIFAEKPIYYYNESIIDRTVSFSNFIKVIRDFIILYLEVNIFNRNKYKAQAKKIYL